VTWFLLLALAAGADSARGPAPQVGPPAVVRADTTARPDSVAPASAAAAAPADTSVRIPGAGFRLGWTPERTAALGAFRLASSTADSTTREGDCRWFGGNASARLTYRDGHLTRAVLMLDKPPPYLVSYALDEMRRAGYRRTAAEQTDKSQTSEWLGRARAWFAITDARMTGNFSTLAIIEPSAPAGADTLDFTQAGGPVDTLPPPVFSFRPPNPDRPPGAVQNGVFGRVMVGALVDTTGAVAAVRIARGISELNDAALAWARQVRYQPYVFMNRPAWFRIGVSVAFTGTHGAPGSGAH
jgi:hypothetical protein